MNNNRPIQPAGAKMATESTAWFPGWKKPLKNLKSPKFRFIIFLFFGQILYRSHLISYFNYDL